MGFGFVVARFGLFVRQLELSQRSMKGRPSGMSLWFGTALIAAGVVVNLFSGWHYGRLIRSMKRGRPFRPHASSLAVGTAVFLALVGLAMAVYLLSIGESVRGDARGFSKESSGSSNRSGVFGDRSGTIWPKTLRLSVTSGPGPVPHPESGSRGS